MLSHVQLNKDQYDRRFWCHQGSGEFSSKSFTDVVTKLQVGDLGAFSFAAKVWCNVAPAKVELLVCFVILWKLNKDVKCVLCNEHDESIEYLFFTCK